VFEEIIFYSNISLFKLNSLTSQNSRLLGFLMQLTAINSLTDRPSRRVSSTYHRFSL